MLAHCKQSCKKEKVLDLSITISRGLQRGCCLIDCKWVSPLCWYIYYVLIVYTRLLVVSVLWELEAQTCISSTLERSLVKEVTCGVFGDDEI